MAKLVQSVTSHLRFSTTRLTWLYSNHSSVLMSTHLVLSSGKFAPGKWKIFKYFHLNELFSCLLKTNSRCKHHGLIEGTEFKLPYSDVVGLDPSLEEMQKVVCIQKIRPNIPSSWKKDHTLSKMTKLLQECWYESAPARLTALRIKKSISSFGKPSPLSKKG